MRARALAAVGVAGLVLAGLGGCASGQAGEPPTGAVGGAGDDLSGDLTVFAAASLQGVFDELLAQFAAEHPDVDAARPVYDGSSTLVTQLREGARADVLATADESTMQDALEAGVMTSRPEVFATNDLVIAVPEGNPRGVKDLPDVTGLAYAMCAEQVPCGAGAAELFAAAGLAPDPISEEQSVTAVANRVTAGEVDAGFIYATDAAARLELTGIFPRAASVTNSYPIGTLSASPAGAAFVDFVRSARGRAVLQAYGFGLP